MKYILVFASNRYLIFSILMLLFCPLEKGFCFSPPFSSVIDDYNGHPCGALHLMLKVFVKDVGQVMHPANCQQV